MSNAFRESGGNAVTSARGSSAIDLSVAVRLRAARLAKGLTQEDAAKALGVSFQQVQKYESGANRISAGRLFQLALLYDRSIKWFFETDDGLTSASKRRARRAVGAQRVYEETG